MTPEQLSLTLAIELSHLQQDVTTMNGKIDKLSDGQATRDLINGLSRTILERDEKTEKRVRDLEDWKTGVAAQVKLAYAFAAVASTVSGVIGHFWK